MRYLLQLLIICLFTLAFSGVYGQLIGITTIKAKPDTSKFNTTDSTIVYPVFNFKKTGISNRVNAVIKKEVIRGYEIEDSTNLPAVLAAAAKQGLINLNYTILRNDSRFLSIKISSEAVGAYASSWHNYYCFNKKTGGLLTIDSLINPVKKRAFLQSLLQKQRLNLTIYKQQLRLRVKNNQLDSSTYDYVLDQLGNCPTTYDPNKFILSINKLEVIFDCEFPHAIQSLNPPSTLVFILNNIKSYLNPGYKLL